MNGATADPLASTMREPNTASIRSRGRSQYFFRTRMNVHNSATKSIIIQSSELARHRVRRWAWRITLNPVGKGVALEPQPQGIPPEHAAHDAHGGHGGIEHEAHDHRTHARMKE